MPYLLRTLALAALLSWLGGCATTPPELPADPRAQEAAQLYQAGDFAGAAELYQSLLTAAPAERRPIYRLLAADSLRQAGQADKAARLIAGLDPATFPAELRPRLTLLRAELALDRGDAENALALTGTLPPLSDPAERRRALRLQARALKALDRPIPRARVLMDLDPLLTDPAEREAVENAILETLVQATPEERATLKAIGTPLVLGWLELADIARGYRHDPAGAAGPLAEWRALFPGHPALDSLVPNYLALHRIQVPSHPRRIAVLLPAHGRFAPAAAAIRAGLLAAWFSAPEESRPALSFHDSSDPAAVWPLLDQLAGDGVDLVIGPLSKKAVRQLARAGELPLPVLALNAVTTDQPPPNTLYQYSLSPEEEARQAALWLAARHLALPGVLYPDNARGRRLLRAFARQWQALGGAEPRTHAYHRDKNDYSPAVAELLDIPRQKKEHDEEEEKTGEKIPFEPELPVDSVVILGNHADLLQLRPLVRFHYGTHLPVVALSRAWEGRLTGEEPYDLGGVMLPDIPWLVEPPAPGDPLARPAMAERFPKAMKRYPRLVAMGMDAETLSQALAELSADPEKTLNGRTGELSLDDQRRVHRRLTWVRLGDPVKILGLTPPADQVPPVELPPKDEPASAPSAAR